MFKAQNTIPCADNTHDTCTAGISRTWGVLFFNRIQIHSPTPHSQSKALIIVSSLALTPPKSPSCSVNATSLAPITIRFGLWRYISRWCQFGERSTRLRCEITMNRKKLWTKNRDACRLSSSFEEATLADWC